MSLFGIFIEGHCGLYVEGTKATGARGASRRRLLYLVDVAEALPLDQYRDRLRRVGWTKATTIADVVKAHGLGVDLDHLFHLAETHTVQNLRRVFAEGEAVAGMRCVQLRFTPKQYEQFAAALRRHGAKPARGRGLRGMEEALMDLIARPGSVRPNEMDLDDEVGRLSEVLPGNCGFKGVAVRRLRCRPILECQRE